MEKLLETIIVRKSINEIAKFCEENNPLYTKSLVILNRFVDLANSQGSKVYFIRLPLDQRLIEYENQHCSFYFEDIKEVANKNKITYIDFT